MTASTCRRCRAARPHASSAIQGSVAASLSWAGTRVPVSSVVVQWQMYQDLGRVLSAFPRLDDQSLSAALAYYEANRQEIDRLIDENEQAASRRH